MKIDEDQMYTVTETQQFLRISQSTILRMLKKGIIRAAKIGKQYRIMGKEILRLISPRFEDQVGTLYNRGRNWLHEND